MATSIGLSQRELAVMVVGFAGHVVCGMRALSTA